MGVKPCRVEKNTNAGNDLDAGLALILMSAVKLDSSAVKFKLG